MRFCIFILDATPCAHRLDAAKCVYLLVAWCDVPMRASYRIDVMCLDELSASYDGLGERARVRYLLISNDAIIDVMLLEDYVMYACRSHRTSAWLSFATTQQ